MDSLLQPLPVENLPRGALAVTESLFAQLQNVSINCQMSATSKPATSKPATSKSATSKPATSKPASSTPGYPLPFSQAGLYVHACYHDHYGYRLRREHSCHSRLQHGCYYGYGPLNGEFPNRGTSGSSTQTDS